MQQLLPSLDSAQPGARKVATKGKRELDQFFTPEWVPERLWELYFSDMGQGVSVIDAGCGRGPFLKAIPPHIPAIGVELDPELAAEARLNTGREVVVGDFRTVDLPFRPTAIIGNPPFTRAVIDGFIDRAQEILPADGRCGFILPASYISFASTFDRLKQHFSIRADMVPRNLFPRASVPLAFYLFTKEHVRRHFGFALFEECHEISGMPKRIQLALYRGENRKSPWHTAVAESLRMLGGEADLPAIYRLMEGRLPRRIETWRDTIRRTLQEGGFRNVGRGVWALPSAA